MAKDNKELSYISPAELHLEDRKAEIELLPEGEWLHPAAPEGKLMVTEAMLDEFISNFKNKVVGKELPLDFRHEGESGTGVPFVGGWIIDMMKKVDEMGRKAIFATLHITDGEAAKRIKEKSLKYISPSLKLGWKRPENGKLYNIIRAASLTNWPYIKNMSPVAPINFSEIEKKEVTEMDRFEELEKKETLSFEEFEEYRELLNDSSDLDEQEIAFKLKEAFEKKVATENKDDAGDKQKKDDKKDKQIDASDGAGNGDKQKKSDDNKDDKGGDIQMSDELKTKIETLESTIEANEKKHKEEREKDSAERFALQEQLRSKEVEGKIIGLVDSGRITQSSAGIP